MLLEQGAPRRLGVRSAARIRFGEEAKARGAWAGRRLMWLDSRPAFELSFWCGTCQFLFKRLEGSNETLSLGELELRLGDGLDALDDGVIDRFGDLLTRGDYVPLLLELQPRLVQPFGPGDYFCEEQVATWSVDAFWGLPEYAQTPYYRTYETAVDSGAHLFEFVVPMVPPSWNDRDRVREHGARLATSARPTAVAVSLLDVCEPATDDGADDVFAHWALTHFVLDGHHKLEAAAAGERRLSLLSVDSSLATREQVERVAGLRDRPRTARLAGR